ncbi:MAG TPA: hypothetical protein PK995_09585 [Bacteroidia bacterium]|nr:hypothetical protein [Bacteroidia bacterium]
MADKQNSINKFSLFYTLICALIFSFSTFAQQNDTINKNIPASDSINLKQIKGQPNIYGLIIQFNKDTVTFNKGEIISNVLYIKNQGSKSYNFSIQMIVPNDWSPIGASTKTYQIEPDKELYIPISIMPRMKVSGNAQVLITAFLQNANNPDEILGTVYFQSIYNKKTAWKISSDISKIYLKNDQDSVSFQLNASNLGNTNQDIIINLKKNKNNIVVKDSVTKENFDVKTVGLKPMQDTTFHLKVIKEKEKRNQRLLDIDNYKPISTGMPEKYQLNFSSQSPRPDEKNAFQSGTKLEIIKLNDEVNGSTFQTNRLPLIMDINTYNILGSSPAMNVWLYGNATLENNQNVAYNFQTFFNQNALSNNFLKQTTFFIFYSNPKIAAQIGNGGIYTIGAFPGSFNVRGEYKFNTSHKGGVFYSQNPQIWFQPTSQTAGAYYEFLKNNKIRVYSQYAHSRSLISNLFADILNLQSSFSIFKGHSFGIRGGLSRRVKNDTAKVGYYVGTNYSGIFNKQWSVQISNLYFAPTFGVFSQERINNLLNISYKIKQNSTLMLRSNLFMYKINPSQNYFDYQMNNELFHQLLGTKVGNLNYSGFYNLFYVRKFMIHSRGLGFNTNMYNPEKFLRYYFTIRAGYNYSPDTLRKNFFFTQVGTQVFYKTLSVNIRYLLGNLTVDERFYSLNNYSVPQFFSISARHQYQFNSKNFVTENYVGYSVSTINYTNVYWQPNMYFYSNNGWRFRAYAEVNWNRLRQFNDFFGTPSLSNTNSNTGKWVFNVFIGFGVRKEFSLPLPYSKKYFVNVIFVPFFDLNGDGKKQDNEKALENVVIRIYNEQKNEEYEMLTNKKGMATLKNIEFGTYNWNVWSLEDLGGWFPHIADSINFSTNGTQYIPFVRGVKIVGKVYLQRDKNSPDADKKLDVSRIKITCQNSKTYTTITDKDGNFEIFVPAGKYVITMDEKVLGTKFKLLQNNIELQVDDKYSNIFIPFHIIEKPKKLKIVKPE